MSLPPSLPDEQMQVDEYLNTERLLDQAEHQRLIDYLTAHAAVDTLTQSLNILAVNEDDDDEEIDIHLCSDSECQGVHTHGDDDEYERGSPVGRTPEYDPHYTPYEGRDY